MREAARLARELRRHDLVVELGDETFRLKKSFEAADEDWARKYILIVGENEVKADAFALKNLATGRAGFGPRAEIGEEDSRGSCIGQESPTLARKERDVNGAPHFRRSARQK